MAQRRMLTESDREETSRGIVAGLEVQVIAVRIGRKSQRGLPGHRPARRPGRLSSCSCPAGAHGAPVATQDPQDRRRPHTAPVVGPDLVPDLAWVGGEGELLGGVGVLFGQRGYDAAELGVHGLGVGLVEDGATWMATCGWADLGPW